MPCPPPPSCRRILWARGPLSCGMEQQKYSHSLTQSHANTLTSTPTLGCFSRCWNLKLAGKDCTRAIAFWSLEESDMHGNIVSLNPHTQTAHIPSVPPPPTVVDCPVSCHVYSPLCCSCCILLLPLQSDFTDEQHKSLDEVCSIFTGVCLPAQSGVRPGSAAHSRPLICSLLHR